MKMLFEKAIYWRRDFVEKEGYCFANVHILVGYTHKSLNCYKMMAEELRRTFPEATDDKIICSMVTNSATVYGFTLIHYDSYIPYREYEGWYHYDSMKSGYDFT